MARYSFARTCALVTTLLAGCSSALAAETPWHQILGPAQGTLPAPRDGLETKISLPTHRKEVATTSIRWETDLAEAMKIAKKENRPIFVTFRCLPCKTCSEFDKTVLEGGPDLNPLFLQFITVRLISAKDVDLRLLPMAQFQDMDVSWWSWFLSPDGQVYSVFGGRDKNGDQTRTSKAALINTMTRVLAHHHDPRRSQWNIDGEAPTTGGKATTPIDLPGFKNWVAEKKNAEIYAHQNCIHCHQASEIVRQGEIDLGQFDKKRDLQPWPFPENAGIVVDRDDGLKIKSVMEGSAAAKVGIKPGDQLAAAAGRRLFSQADFRGVLHRAPIGPAKVDVVLLRDGKPMNATLDLPADWRRTDLSWRASVAEGNVGAAPGFWPIDGGNMRQRLGIEAGKMAVKPHLGFKKNDSPAVAAGLKGNDVITAVNGESPNIFGREFLVWFRMKFEPGEDVTLSVKNEDGSTRDVKFRPAK